MRKKLLILSVFSVISSVLFAQEVEVIDNKGTIKTVTFNQVSSSLTTPTLSVEGDIWFDLNTNETKVYDNQSNSWIRINSTLDLWSGTLSYTTNELVIYQGSIYKNLTGTNSNTTPDTDTTNWKSTVGHIVPLWKSDTNGGSYATNDIINYNGVLYKSLTGTNKNTTPNSDATNWTKVVATFPEHTYPEHTYPAPETIYQNFDDAINDGTVVKLGNPTIYSNSNRWNGRYIFSYGGNAENDGDGMEINVPTGTEVVWLRLLGERWNNIKVYYLDGAQEDLGIHSAGFRNTNIYVPGGGARDGQYNMHEWLPIAVPRSGRLALISKPNTNKSFWVSGLAFSKNPWSHTHRPAVTFRWASNGGDAVNWTGRFDNDQLAQVPANTKMLLKIPVVENGKDKLLYFVCRKRTHAMVTYETIRINGTALTERLTFTHDNPFSRHWRMTSGHGYVAVKVPANLIPSGSTYLDVEVDTGDGGTKFNIAFFFYEAGTHDVP